MIVVCADDFGHDAKTNEAIISSFKNGLIDSAFVMVNMPFAKEAFELACRENILSKIGLHINLTEGSPLTDGIKKDRLFCDENGVFNSRFRRTVFTRFFLSRKRKKLVKDEIIAQINLFFSMGFSFKSINSHHHVHKDYSIFKIILSLNSIYEFESMRIAKNTGQMHLFNKFYNKFINKKILKSKIRPNSDYLFSSLDSAMRGYKKWMDAEIEVHPSIKNNILFDNKCELINVHKLDGGNENVTI